MELTVLDYLALKAPVCYLSDLHDEPLACAHILYQIPVVEVFSLKDWNDAGTYLSVAYTPQQDHEAARKLIVELLLQKV